MATKHTSLNYIRKKRTQLKKSNIVRQTFLGTVAKTVEDSYSFDIFSKAGPYRALVLRVDGQVVPPPNNPLTSISNFFGFHDENRVLSIKAKIIDDFDSALPMPSAFGDEEGSHQSVINLHDTFYASTSETNNIDAIKPGDIVLVDYMDRVNKTDPIIVGLTSISSPLESLGKVIDSLKEKLKDFFGDALDFLDDDGECGGVKLEKSKCAENVEIKYNAVYRTENVAEYRLLEQKLKTLKNGGWIDGFSAPDLSLIITTTEQIDENTVQSIDVFDTEDGAGVMNISYNWTKTSKCNGHPEWCKALEIALKKIADDFIAEGKPENAAMIKLYNTRRTKQEQMNLRIFYCVPPDDPRCPSGKGCKGKRLNGQAIPDDVLNKNAPGCSNPEYCDRPVCVGDGKSNHEKGEATDFLLAKWPVNIRGQEVYSPNIETIPNDIQNIQAQLSNPARNKLKDIGQNLSGTTVKIQPISSEGWHFNT